MYVLRYARISRFSCNCDLDLDTVTLTYKLDIDILKMYLRAKNGIYRSRLLKVRARTGQTHKHAHRHYRQMQPNALPQRH